MNGHLIKILVSAAVALLLFMGTNIRINTAAIYEVKTDIARIQVSQETMEYSVAKIERNVEKIADKI